MLANFASLSLMYVSRRRLAGFVLGASVVGLVAGCGSGLTGGGGAASGTGLNVRLSGTVHGGQQPVVGAQIQLYAAGKTGLASTPRTMLAAPATTVANGGFSVTGQYSCNAGDQVYLVATGGDAGAGANSGIAMMAALGPCAPLLANASTTFLTVDEVTTVAAVYALGAYMSGAQGLGSDATNTQSTDGLAAAFANARTMADLTTGTAPATSMGNGVVPQATINSLANSLAACINSTGVGSTQCSNLFSDTTVSGSTPGDTLQAALNLAHFPATNSSQVWALAGSTPPFLPTLSAAPASYAIQVKHPSDVLTYHNNNARTGVQAAESTLTPANVNSTTFGKILTLPTDSYLFAHPLYLGGMGMPDGAVHNVLMAATTHGTVYAFDADGNNPGTGYLWSQSLVPAGERFAASADYGCSNPPEAGIVGTPVVDRDTATMYVSVKTVTTTGSTFYQRLHAISLLDGTERAGSPTLIAPSFAGTGAGSSGGVVTFDAQHELERSALLLAPNASGGKTVWVAFASHCDIGPYHGIIVGYDSATLANLAKFIDTPNGSDGGIWMGAGGLTVDSQGYLYALSGNGTFDANTGGSDYGDAVLKLAVPAAGGGAGLLTVSDSFTPSNQAYLDQHDLDVGGTDGILIADPASGVAPNLLIGSDKNGSVYLLNTASLGGYAAGAGGTNADVQDFTAGGTFVDNFAFFNNMLYTSTPLKAYAFMPGTATTAGRFNTTPVATATTGQSAPVVSANGTLNGIVWTQDTNSQMLAYSAATLTPLYNTSQAAGNRDLPAAYIKFMSPLIANGKVYLNGMTGVTVYGLLP